MTKQILALIVIGSVLAGCGASSPGARGNSLPNGATSDYPDNRFAAANSCYALQSLSTGGLVIADGVGGYVANASSVEDAEAFFFKPSALGRYLLYGVDESLPSANGNAVVTSADITDEGVWELDMDGFEGNITLNSVSAGNTLIVDANGKLTLGTANAGNDQFRFALTTKACTPFVEMPLGIIGDTFKGQGVDQPIIGFADVHSHINMAHEVSADDTAGPAAGGAFYGQPFHRLGVTHALGSCAEFHGENGERDANNVLTTSPGSTHDTQGWPTFTDWPASHQLTHQAAYYRWLERAWLAGLRVMVNYGTGIQGLCELGKAYTGNVTSDCADHAQGLAQIAYAKEMQDYIDAQHGGPGEGWFRIVLSPQEARQVINDGKMAVILGLEGSQMFYCGVTFNPDGSETRDCTPESFDALLAEAWDLGVRQVVPLHNIDNALAGGSILRGGGAAPLNLINFYDTGSFYKTVACPNGGNDDTYHITGGGQPGVVTTGDDPLSQAVAERLDGDAPVYPPGQRCNSRPLNEMGEYAFKRFAETGMVVSLDHAPLLVKRTLLDYVKTLDPPFPLVSGHGYQGGVRKADVIDLYKAGGYSYPYKPNGEGFVTIMNSTKALYDQAKAEGSSKILPFAFGYGFDINGFGGYADPRGNADKLVMYPLQLFRGEGWGAQFTAAGIAPMTVEQLTITDGRRWDIEQDGSAHYGLIPDFIEEIRLEGGEEAISALYNSAEVYIRLWESIYNQRK